MSVTCDRVLAELALTGVLLTAGCAAQDDAEAEPPSRSPAGGTPSQQPSGDHATNTPDDTTRGGAPDYSDLSVITTSLDTAWSIAFHGESALVSERDSGRILEIAASGNATSGDTTTGSTTDGTIREVVTVPGVAARGEGGLLGLAIHPGGDTAGGAPSDDTSTGAEPTRDTPDDATTSNSPAHLYAYLTTAEDNRVVRFALTGGAGDLGVGEPETIIDGIPAAGNHNGGRIAFGPDGMLYVTTGDAGNTSHAQDPDSLAGKILRLTPDGDVPDDNPTPGSPVHSMGNRNPQGLDWDEDGTLYASEFGQDTWDELNVIEPGGNYGWPEVEGIAQDSDPSDDAFIDPVQQWEPAESSPSGLAVIGDSIVIAALRGERLWEVPVDELGQSSEHLTGEYGRLREVAEAPDGSVWILTHNTDGRGDPAADDDRILRVPVR